ncbi:nicotinate-nucleotide adenylyltransferase [Paraliobacillus quinghaiensis]|uniref:Probable nicotinate-nucleotide adenylyltransferase n=1 Tax=Paraliobacillus quinghaiensis TaxID=470815 RepID=A0A917TNY7_9BACI|nr:nicotinate-nucleotide adenylyltransferase [Paraliobacillus quinghaiensis]GGM31046.1 nicotinate-nucleotide adenylyltransferase [Paraliobacillus quinghaiensis]
MKKVGILGGTFDPPHIGHLMIAEEVHDQLKLDEVWFIPSYEPPHKEAGGTDIQNRIAMVEAAIEDNDHFTLSTIEVDRAGKSYTFDTIKLLNEKYQDIKFYFIIGADMVEYLPKWYRIEELIKLIQFVGVKRPMHNLKTDFPVCEIDIPVMDISSTMIRERIKNGKSIKYFVPSKVLQIIKEHQLYESN